MTYTEVTMTNIGDYNTGSWNTGDSNTGSWNTGDSNTGHHNTGDSNTGHYNAGDYNIGYHNAGYHNAGYHNAGHHNIGHHNTGDYNIGHHNTGDSNTGHYNTGSWNTTCFSSGIFNTVEQKTPIFNGSAFVLMSEFRKTPSYKALFENPLILTEWVDSEDATPEQKALPNYIPNSGVLISYTWEEACLNWWNSNSEETKNLILSIEGFDASIFKEVTGIEV